MSSDWQDNNPGTRNVNENAYAAPHFADQQDQADIRPETDPLTEYDVEEPSDVLPTRLEVLLGHMRQLSPVLAPLFFGGVTFLFILPFVLTMRAYLSTIGSLPTGLILLAIGVVLLVFALAQGIMLYYAGPNDVLWSLGMVGGFALFLLTGCFAIFGLFPTIVLLIVLVLLGYLLARLSIRPTPEGRVDLVEAFGKYSRTLFPGLNFVAPWERIVSKLDTRVRVWTCPMQRVPVSRSEEVQLSASISYQLMPEDAYLAILYVSNWEKSLQELLITTIQEVVVDLSPDDFIAWPQSSRSRHVPSNLQDGGNWDRINKAVTIRMQEQVAQWGVQVNEVHIRDVSLVPHIPQMPQSIPQASVQPANASIAGSTTPTAATKPNQAQPRPKNPNPQPATPVKAQAAQAKPPTPASPPPPAPAPSPAPEPAPASTPSISKAETLTEAYEAVRSGRITDPDTIREIAAHFESIANDPEERQRVDFDAARAAHTLRDRAALIEEQMRTEADFDNDTQPDWSISPTQH
jgi:hypothetical protein